MTIYTQGELGTSICKAIGIDMDKTRVIKAGFDEYQKARGWATVSITIQVDERLLKAIADIPPSDVINKDGYVSEVHAGEPVVDAQSSAALRLYFDRTIP